MNLYEAITALTEYGIQKNLIQQTDRTFIINSYLELFGEDSFEDKLENQDGFRDDDQKLAAILDTLTDIALERGLLPDGGVTQRDLFDTKLMGILVGKPHEIIAEFEDKYKVSPEKATDWFYDFSQNTNYIRRDRIAKDRRWKVDSEYGLIDITINLSKPEKDPKAIAAAKNAKQLDYPKCQLCMENEGYAGRVNHPARQNHRIIPITIDHKKWGFQYSPYVYYNEHCIVFNGQHIPMSINHDTFVKLFDFVSLFPHYFLGSNADLPIVGGSILAHDHFQGGHYSFAMENAPIEKNFVVFGHEDVEAGILHWPLSAIRLRSESREAIIRLADHILDKWRTYTDVEAFIYAESSGELHNTITPIARMKSNVYELDLALRNNITTEEHPFGVYHPHEEYHHIKKENIGLIEVMGLAVLPARLDSEMKLLAECLVNGTSFDEHVELAKHKKWGESIRSNYKSLTKENIDEVIQTELGRVFVKVLEDAGVFKCTDEGRAAFDRFINTL